jgi:hypothetical protein
MKGAFFVENRSEFTTPFGPGTLLEIMGYDANRKVYQDAEKVTSRGSTS